MSPPAVALLTEQIATFLSHNRISSPDEAFPLFDRDHDDLLSVADLFESCKEVQIATSEQQVAAWIACYATQNDKSFLTSEAWLLALKNADGSEMQEMKREQQALPREESATESEYGRMQKEQESQVKLMEELRQAQSILESRDARVQGNLHGDVDEEHSSSAPSIPADSAGSGDSFELQSEEPAVIGVLNSITNQQQAAIAIQARARGMAQRKKMTILKPVEMEKDPELEKRENAAELIQECARGMVERSKNANKPTQKDFASEFQQGGASIMANEQVQAAIMMKMRKHEAEKKAEGERVKARQEKAAIRIQSRARGVASRKMVARAYRGQRNAMAGKLNGHTSQMEGNAHRNTSQMEGNVDKVSIGKMRKRHEAALCIQRRQRGTQERARVAELKRWVEQQRAAIAIQRRVRGNSTRSGFLPSGCKAVGKSNNTLLANNEYSDDKVEDDYDEEFDDEEMPRWIGAETEAAAQRLQAGVRGRLQRIDMERKRAHSKISGELEKMETERVDKRLAEQDRLAGLREERRKNDGDVLSVQIDMMESDWAGAKRHKSVLKYATQRLARSLVYDLVDATVDEQIELAAKRERQRIKKDEEANRGYRKPRIVEAISQHIKNATFEEYKARQEHFSQSNKWFKQRTCLAR